MHGIKYKTKGPRTMSHSEDHLSFSHRVGHCDAVLRTCSHGLFTEDMKSSGRKGTDDLKMKLVLNGDHHSISKSATSLSEHSVSKMQ